MPMLMLLTSAMIVAELLMPPPIIYVYFHLMRSPLYYFTPQFTMPLILRVMMFCFAAYALMFIMPLLPPPHAADYFARQRALIFRDDRTMMRRGYTRAATLLDDDARQIDCAFDAA